MRFRLRTLLIVLALGPPVLAAGWWAWSKWREERPEAIGVNINNWGCVRPPRFPFTPEEQAAMDAWIAPSGNPREK
jgi:hypothetical protein